MTVDEAVKSVGGESIWRAACREDSQYWSILADLLEEKGQHPRCFEVAAVCRRILNRQKKEEKE